MSISFRDPEDFSPMEATAMRTVVVHPPHETKRPVGFAPWPKAKAKKRKKG